MHRTFAQIKGFELCYFIIVNNKDFLSTKEKDMKYCNDSPAFGCGFLYGTSCGDGFGTDNFSGYWDGNGFHEEIGFYSGEIYGS